ncbi:actin polymerizing complex subunit, putative [Candida dubliniensis CD36]|uniref:Arp2/3 complex 34 kDa subunit n=1 Tax=Candida dubliniensis (strain CD36 / ATCC MYA-646 / CBS 7987 / NCPF 3949 / NRRL Y-17841) TaxID=573826 RepID=B9W818_CANDC|nr:actin polymerizing complex subunit, putative [Candida dubliniensis CD36]CAX44833.1 actin polymerizing complex subunit, putative [Candida dubliniensis CD36]
MLHIEQNNLLIEKTLTERLFPNTNDGSIKSLDRIVSDFDFTTFHLSTLPGEKHLLLISISLRCWPDLIKHDVVKYLNDKYQPFNEVLTILSTNDIEQGYDYSLVLDTTTATAQNDEFKLELIKELSNLKRNSMAAPFEQAFNRYDELSKKYANANTYSEEIQQELFNESVSIIKYRGIDECIYLKPSFDRVTVIFSTVFQDETDKIFGKVFLQEFVDARKRSVQTAPQVLYSHIEPPLDIQNVVNSGNGNGNNKKDNYGYVTFVLFPRHLVLNKRENCISHIELFRSYFHYHIKCSKAYMHSRMRFRVKEYLKILNRAKPENLDDEGNIIENRKTASGRRFDIRA